MHTPLTLPKSRISATTKSKFNFKNIISEIVCNVKNKIDFAKNRGASPLGLAPATCAALRQNGGVPTI